MNPQQIADHLDALAAEVGTDGVVSAGYLQGAARDLREAARQQNAERQALEAKVVMATESAKRLAIAIWTQHYHFDAPSWQAFDDLMGLLSQIDNMVSGLSRQKPAAAQVPDEMPAEFLEYVTSNYRPRTIISDPSWHAPKLWRAAVRAIRAAAPTHKGPGK